LVWIKNHLISTSLKNYNKICAKNAQPLLAGHLPCQLSKTPRNNFYKNYTHPFKQGRNDNSYYVNVGGAVKAFFTFLFSKKKPGKAAAGHEGGRKNKCIRENAGGELRSSNFIAFSIPMKYADI
jgi:hypothetical protein